VTSKKIVSAYKDWARLDEPLVLASVYETEGSTYSKTGAQMLIAANGDFQGMLSGGCLEGDLGERARRVLQTGAAETVTYDMRQDDEELWGLGVGCDGVMRIFLQPLLPASGYQPFAAMVDALSGEDPVVAATVLQSPMENLAIASGLVEVAGRIVFSNVPQEYESVIAAEAARVLSEKRPQLCHPVADGDAGSASFALLVTILRPPPRVLILGAGPDAEPVARFIDELGWRATVQDHRPAYIENGDFSAAEQVIAVPVADLDSAIDVDRYDAAIIMSHHLASDREYLRALANSTVSSIGLLGPRERRRRLLDELGDAAGDLGTRLHGPAGIEIGASGPASIALSIVAQMHRDLADAFGKPV
jgi:xanthine/CO dehydrogenase XdhC/CoxF family maturation factor